jgi:hypothetical protein
VKRLEGWKEMEKAEGKRKEDEEERRMKGEESREKWETSMGEEQDEGSAVMM